MSRRPLKGNRWLQVMVAPLLAIHIRLVYYLSRLVTCNDQIPRRFLEEGRPVIACFWHGRLMAMAVCCVAQRGGRLSHCWPRRHPAHLLISTRAEGRVFSLASRWLGVGTVAGATGADGAGAARSIRQALSSGVSVLIAADGPRGPYRHLSPGVIRLARATGAPIVPVGCSSSLRTVRSGWDRLAVPWPFGRVACVFGEPIEVQQDASQDSIASMRSLLEDRLNEATDEADRVCGQTAASNASELDPVRRR